MRHCEELVDYTVIARSLRNAIKLRILLEGVPHKEGTSSNKIESGSPCKSEELPDSFLNLMTLGACDEAISKTQTGL